MKIALAFFASTRAAFFGEVNHAHFCGRDLAIFSGAHVKKKYESDFFQENRKAILSLLNTIEL